MSELTLRISRLALSDVQSILEISEREFGTRASERYNRLINAALDAIRANPKRAGVAARPEIADGVYTYHLTYARKMRGAERVKRPRHLIVFRAKKQTVLVGRVLHDAMELARHVPRVWRDLGWD